MLNRLGRGFGRGSGCECAEMWKHAQEGRLPALLQNQAIGVKQAPNHSLMVSASTFQKRKHRDTQPPRPLRLVPSTPSVLAPEQASKGSGLRSGGRPAAATGSHARRPDRRGAGFPRGPALKSGVASEPWPRPGLTAEGGAEARPPSSSSEQAPGTPSVRPSVRPAGFGRQQRGLGGLVGVAGPGLGCGRGLRVVGVAGPGLGVGVASVVVGVVGPGAGRGRRCGRGLGGRGGRGWPLGGAYWLREWAWPDGAWFRSVCGRGLEEGRGLEGRGRAGPDRALRAARSWRGGSGVRSSRVRVPSRRPRDPGSGPPCGWEGRSGLGGAGREGASRPPSRVRGC